jgi:ribosomal protein L29
MSSVVYYGKLARRLVEAEAKTTSKPIRDCIASVARRLREPRGSIFSLIYEHPKSIRLELAQSLVQELERQLREEIRSLEHELVGLRTWSTFAHPGEIEEVEADLAALKERVAKLRGAA